MLDYGMVWSRIEVALAVPDAQLEVRRTKVSL